MTAPTDNAALRAALDYLRPMALNSAQTVSAMRRVEEALAVLAAAIPPEQDGYAEGRAEGLREAAKIADEYQRFAQGVRETADRVGDNDESWYAAGQVKASKGIANRVRSILATGETA